MALHLAFLVGVVVVVKCFDRPLTTSGIVLGAVLLVAPLALSRGWLLVGYDREKAGALIERSMQRIVAPYETVHDGFRMALKSGDVHIRIVELPGRLAVLRFIAARRTPKLERLRGLLIKEFRRVVPRPAVTQRPRASDP